MARRKARATDGLAVATEGHKVMIKRDHPAVIIQAGFEMVPACRAVEVVAHIVFARPLQLHGLADFARDPGDLSHKVIAKAPAEATANTRQVDVYAVFRDAQCPCNQ